MVEALPVSMARRHTPEHWQKLMAPVVSQHAHMTAIEARKAFIREYANSSLYGAIAFPALVLPHDGAFLH